MVGRTIGKYKIVEQVGRGGMGTVYKAIDETLDRTVAIKVLNGDLLDQDSVERFRREAVTLARLNHPRIGAIHELTRDGHDLLMVMEFISGETFEKLIERSAPLEIPEAVRLCGQVLEGLHYAHKAGVVHRDLKPANVIVTPSGDVKIMDFGIARVQGSEHLTSVGFMVGTPAYMSPEQVRGEEVDPRMDLYSIAVVLYRLLTHKLPFQGETAIAMIHSQLSNPPTPPRQFRADLPDWVVATLTRGLAKAPADRFQTAVEFRTALEQGITGKMAIVDILGPSHAETMGPTRTPMPMPVPTATGMAAAPATQATAPSGTSSAVRPAPSSVSQPIPSSVPPAPSAVAPAPPPPTPPQGTTVTLRAPHLATAGILVVALIAGIAVLAFFALRKPTSTPAPATTTASSTPAPAPVSTPEPAAAPATPPPAAAPPAAAAPVTTTATPTPPPGGATAARGAGSATAPARGTAPAAADAARGRASTPAPAPAAPVPAPAAAAPTPTTPAAADAPAEHFADIRVLVLEGQRGREEEALLGLEPGTLIVRARDGRMLRTLPYRNVAALTYARARRPRGQNIANAAALPENVGGSGFLGGARHWLTLQTADEFLVLRLEDRNVIAIMRSLEARTGLKALRTD